MAVKFFKCPFFLQTTHEISFTSTVTAWRQISLNSLHQIALLRVHVLWIHTALTYVFWEKQRISAVRTWSNWVLVVGLPCTAPLVVRHEKRQLFLSSSEISESGQRLPKINRLSVQPWGWVRVTLHGAHSLGFSLPASKHRPSLLHWLRTDSFFQRPSQFKQWSALKLDKLEKLLCLTWHFWECHSLLEITQLPYTHFISLHCQLIDSGGR